MGAQRWVTPALTTAGGVRSSRELIAPSPAPPRLRSPGPAELMGMALPRLGGRVRVQMERVRITEEGGLAERCGMTGPPLLWASAFCSSETPSPCKAVPQGAPGEGGQDDTRRLPRRFPQGCHSRARGWSVSIPTRGYQLENSYW